MTGKSAVKKWTKDSKGRYVPCVTVENITLATPTTPASITYDEHCDTQGYYFVKLLPNEIALHSSPGTTTLAESYQPNYPTTWKDIMPNSPSSNRYYVPNQGWLIQIPPSTSPSDPPGTPDPKAAKSIAWQLIKGQPPTNIPPGWCVPISPCPKGVLCCTDPTGKMTQAEYNAASETPFAEQSSTMSPVVLGGIGGFICIVILCVIFIIWWRRRKH